MTTPKHTVTRRKREIAKVGKGMRLGGYIRVSKAGERDLDDPESSQTVFQQCKDIMAWALVRDVTVVGPGGVAAAVDDDGRPVPGTWYDDSRSVSGKTMDRPALNHLLGDIRNDVVGGAIIRYLSRFSRAKASDAMDIVRELAEMHKPLAILDMPDVDPTTGMGEMMLMLMLQMQRYFSMERKERWIRNRDSATDVKRLYMANTTPFGYIRVDSDGNPVGPHDRTGRLDKHPVEALLVTELFERRARGESWRSLADWLQSTGMRPPAMRKQIKDPNDPARTITSEQPRTSSWTGLHIRRIIERSVYLGILDDDKYSGVKTKGSHPPLTDPITWQAANKRTSGGTGTHVGGQTELLNGLVRCGGCRYVMSVHRVAQYDHQRDRYVCRRHIQSHDCPAPAYIPIDGTRMQDKRVLTPEQVEGVRRRVSDGETRKAIAKELGVNHKTISHALRMEPAMGLVEYVEDELFRDDPENPGYLVRYEEERNAFGSGEGLEELEADLKIAEADYEDVAMDLKLRREDPDMYKKIKSEAKSVADEKRAEYEEKAALVARPLIDGPVRELREAWPDMELADKRQLLQALVQAVFVRKGPTHGASGRVEVVWATDPPVDVPRRGRGTRWVPTPFPFKDAD